MDQARWNRVEALLQEALDHAPEEREEFLARACGSDASLRREIDALLARESDGSVLESPAIAIIAPHLAATPLSGQQIGHYRIGARIGAGGMGEVYEASDERLRRVVAIKALPAEFTADADRVRRFEQEALAASRLNHPNIVTIFEFLDAGGSRLIASERVEGQTLREILSEKPRTLTVERAVDIAIQIAVALEAAHTASIIHRDIKPENVMVRSDGLVKVLDFGIAKLSEEPPEPRDANARVDARTNLTTPGAVLGTAKYMSPEQSRGDPLDARSDLYSLGLLTREMLPDETPRELQRIVHKLLRPAREDRYSSASELLDDLRRVKRRLESRGARRMIVIGGAAVVAAIAIAAIAALLSMSEAWDERVLRDGHFAAARQAAFSPDGRLLVTCGEDGQVIVWDFARRERLATLQRPAHMIAFSPNGRWLATGGTNGAITIWDASTWREVRVLRGHQSEITAIAFSPNAALLASASNGGAGTILWDARRWEKLRQWPGGAHYGSFAFTRDQRNLIVSFGLSVHDLADGKRAQYQTDVTVDWVALSPDGTHLATIDALGDVAFYRFSQRPELVAQHRAHQDHGRSIAYSPDGTLIASGAEDILLWDAATLRKVARFEHPAIVWNVAFSPDGRWLVSTHGDGAVLVWDIAERERVANLSEHSRAVRAVAFAADGKRVASAGEDRTLTVWDVERGRKDAVLAHHATRVASVAWSRDGSQLGSGDQDGVVILWDLAKRRPRLTIRPRVARSPAYCLAISPDGRTLATTYGIYSTADGRALVDFYATRDEWGYGQLYGAAFSADGRRVAFAGDSGWILLWDAASGRLINSRHVTGTRQITVDLSPDGKWLVTGEDEGAVRLWSVSPLRQVAVLGRHAARVKSVAFSPDNTAVASTGDDKMIALWDVKRRKLKSRIGTHASPIYSIDFSPDGRQLVSGEHDRSVRVYTRRRSVFGLRLD